MAAEPRKLFLLDGIGALVSAIMLGLVLVQLENIFGIPVKALYILAAIPCFFALYDLVCYLSQTTKASGLRLIAYANLAYCAFSIYMAMLHRDTITTLGYLYIIGEILIILYIVFLELGVANKLSK